MCLCVRLRLVGVVVVVVDGRLIVVNKLPSLSAALLPVDGGGGGWCLTGSGRHVARCRWRWWDVAEDKVATIVFVMLRVCLCVVMLR